MNVPAAILCFSSGMAVASIIYEVCAGRWLWALTFVGILMVATGGLYQISREGR